MMIKNTQSGFVRMIILIVVIVLILSYLGFDLKTFIESDQTQGNLRYVWGGVLWTWDVILEPIWTRYLSPVLTYFWGFIGGTLENFGEGSLNPFSDKNDIEPLQVEFQ